MEILNLLTINYYYLKINKEFAYKLKIINQIIISQRCIIENIDEIKSISCFVNFAYQYYK